MRVAVLGAGIMGAPMARNLALAGHEVRSWNRTRARAEALSGVGIEVAASPADASRGTDVVVTMLSDGDAVAAAMEGDHGALAGMERDTVWAQTSTIGIAGTERCQLLADGRGVALVDAPVLGTKEPAEQGALTVLASGPASALERCTPLFDAIGARTLELGAAGAGTRLKLVLNHWLLALVEALAGTLALAKGLAVDPDEFLGTIEGGPLDLPYARTKGRMMIDGEFPPSFPLELALKDARLVLEAVERHDLDAPLAELLERRLRQADEAGLGREDLAATSRTLAPPGS